MEQDKTRLIFLNNIDAFVGPDLETIGPFAADQEAGLPKRIADVLINKGDAEKV